MFCCTSCTDCRRAFAKERCKSRCKMLPLEESKICERCFLCCLIVFYQSSQEPLPVGGIASAYGQESKISGFFQLTFLSSKAKQWRPIQNLSNLNQFLKAEKFKTEILETIRTSLQQVEWVTSIDFKDTYYHIPIQEQSRKYLRFHIQGRSYQFKALPFRLSTAPMEFTVIPKEVKLMAIPKVIRVHQYLDDWLVLWLGPAHTGPMAESSSKTTRTSIPTSLSGLAVHVFDGSVNSYRKASSPWATTHEIHTVASQKQLEGTTITRKGGPYPQVCAPPSKMLAGGRKCPSRSTITPTKTCSGNLYGIIKRRWGPH